jgi:hypothetical protein
LYISEELPIEFCIRYDLHVFIVAVHFKCVVSLISLVHATDEEGEDVGVVIGFQDGFVGDCDGVGGAELSSAEQVGFGVVFGDAFAVVALDAQVDVVLALDGVLRGLAETDEEGALAGDGDAELGVAEGFVRGFGLAVGVLLCELAEDGGDFQPGIIKNGAEVERLELLYEIIHVHPEYSVILLLIVQQLHESLAHQFRLIREISVPLDASAAVGVLELQQPVAFDFPYI